MNESFTKEGSWKIFEQLQAARDYPANCMIYWQGEQAERFYYLQAGKVKTFLSSENGTEKTLTILSAGTLFGEAAFFDGLPRVSSAKTLTDCKIVAVDRETLLGFFSSKPELAMQMLGYLSRTVRMLSAQVDNMTFLQADQRIAQLLLQLGASDDVVSTTHEELGSLAGTSRVTVSKILNRFARQGWIATEYRTVRLTNPDGLRRFVSEEQERNERDGC